MRKKYESEEDTKLRYITPALQKAGWSTHSMLTEYSLRSDRYQIIPGKNEARPVKPKGPNRPDYILCHRVNVPIAVVEAKKGAKVDNDGLDQAIAYAKILDVRFAYSSAGKKFIEYDIVKGTTTELEMDEFPSPDELWKRICDDRNISPDQQSQLDNALYYTSSNFNAPRYYQMVAINKVVDAILVEKKKRALLVMATGTGKTYTAFQIVWRLKKAGMAKNVLYLADRNQLVDQTIVGDFQPFKAMTKITKGKIDKNYEIYFGLYQQLKGRNAGDSEGEGEEGIGESFADNFRQVSPDYFDLIIVDECHRGSAKEESSWREILEYFSSAVQVGLTATPSNRDGADNTEYFGEPLYTYSLKQGIEDGFLAPYQVISIQFDRDREGWEPEEGERDDQGKLIPKKRYTLRDYNKTVELRQRIYAVAEKITEQLHKIGRDSKTIVFCVTQRHAALMRDALRACNVDKMQENSTYVVRMTGDDEEGRGLYSAFTSIGEPYPVVVTTSKLLTTGADTKCVKLIVLDSVINSMTEFKQIIGRGTRLRADAGKTMFTILDFRGACELFSDPEFDGEPSGHGNGGSYNGGGGGDGGDYPPERDDIYTTSVVTVTEQGRKVSYLDENGKLVTVKYEDYTRKAVLELFGSHDGFIEIWNGEQEKKAIIQMLADKGILIEDLKERVGNPDIGEFDLICSIAFGTTPLTRHERASRVRREKFFDKYQGTARAILERLLDIYAHLGVAEVEDVKITKSPELREFGAPAKIMKAFGGKPEYQNAVKDLQAAIYAEIKQTNNRKNAA